MFGEDRGIYILQRTNLVLFWYKSCTFFVPIKTVRFIMSSLEPCRFSCLWKNKVMVFERYSKFLYTYQILDFWNYQWVSVAYGMVIECILFSILEVIQGVGGSGYHIRCTWFRRHCFCSLILFEKFHSCLSLGDNVTNYYMENCLIWV